MALSKFIQEPGEYKRYVLDYSDWLDEGEQITSVTFTVTPSDGVTVPISAIDDTGTLVSFFATGGTDGVKYTVEATINTDGGQIKEDQIYFVIRER